MRMAIALALQIHRMLRLRSADDVSLGFFALLIPGFLLWGFYGLSRHDRALVIPNTLFTQPWCLCQRVTARLKRRSTHSDLDR